MFDASEMEWKKNNFVTQKVENNDDAILKNFQVLAIFFNCSTIQ